MTHPKTMDGRMSDLSRRAFAAIAAAAGLAVTGRRAHAALVNTDVARLPPYGNGTLPAGVRK